MVAAGAAQHLTGNARFLRPLLEELEAVGMPVRDLLGRAELDPEELRLPDNRYPLARAAKLFEIAVEQSGDRALPVRATLRYRPDANLFDYASMASATLGDALTRVSRYGALMIDGFDLELERGPSLSRMFYRSRFALLLPDAMMEYIVGVGVAASKHWLKVDFPVQVEFRHREPDDIRVHQRVFAGGVTFGARETAVVFPTLALDFPLPEADPEMATVLDTRATTVLSRSRTTKPSFKAKARDAMLLELEHGEPTLEVLAERLKLSARTLRRRLREEGTTHRDLLDELRHELAVRWLKEPGAQIEDVAQRLGFAEATSFYRAFRRWEGTTPASFMRGEPRT